MKKIIAIITIILLIFLCGCSTTEDTSSNTSSQSTMPSVDFSKTDSDMFTERDIDSSFDTKNSITIKLDGDSITASDDSVKISGSKITITKEATHIISGTLNDGMIIVEADQKAKLQLVFDNVNITSKTSAPLYVKQADKVFITLKDGSKNTLSNGGSFTTIDDNNIDATVFSKQDITFNGSGALTITAPAGHGVVSKDDLVFTNGSYNITSSSHAIDANDSVRIKTASFVIDAGKDAIKAENSDDQTLGFVYVSSGNIKAEAQGDGISASAYMQVKSGNFDILAGGGSKNGTKKSSDSWGGFGGGKGGKGGPGGERPMMPTASTIETEDEDSSSSMKGLKSGNSMQISGGTFKINSADDAVHSNVSLTVKNGKFNIATGDDALHAEQSLTVEKGEINITESYEGLEALKIKVLGGNISLIATDDGLNAAGGTDSSGITGGRDGMFGGKGGKGGGMSANSDGSIVISGGTLKINSSGDGIDANGTVEITGGHTTVTGPTKGDTATLDYDVSATISGGTFIGTGASGMAQTFSESEQGIVAISCNNQTANTQIVLKNSKGKTIITHAPTLDFAVVILSSPDIIKGETYTLSIGDATQEFTAE